MTEEQLRDIQGITKRLGDSGEDFVLRYERTRLHRHPHANDIQIVGRKDVGLGYDILSFQGATSQHHDRYIEVKTYAGNPHFFLSQSEQAAAAKYRENYCIYLVDHNRINEPGYKPIIITDPINNLDSKWQEKSQSKEYIYADDTSAIPEDIHEGSVIIGCYNSNEHLTWILHNHAYNVRQGHINGNVNNDEVSTDVKYLLLYAVMAPRTYRLYRISGYRIVSRNDMISLRYPNPHAQQYILYQLTALVGIPALDIMQLLRNYNDKLHRSSGTPIFMSGKDFMNYVLRGPNQQGTIKQRIYSNEGKPWSAVQGMKLRALYLSGKNIATLAHEFHRTPDEIKNELKRLGLKV